MKNPQFSWWAGRTGNPTKLVKQIRQTFDELSPEEAEIYAVRREGEELYFTWPMYGVKGRKPAEGK